jgi:hypothetical protein
MLASEAVSTAFLILPVQAMSLDEFLELLGERAHPMMFLLPSDVCGDLIHI